MTAISIEPAHTGESLLATWLGRDELREKVLLQMREHPVLICPTAAIPAFHHGEREWQVEGKTVKYLDAWSYCEWFNLLGFPAVVVPMGRSAEGLPIGVQIVGRPWEEEVVLAIAAILETECGPWQGSPGWEWVAGAHPHSSVKKLLGFVIPNEGRNLQVIASGRNADPSPSSGRQFERCPYQSVSNAANAASNRVIIVPLTSGTAKLYPGESKRARRPAAESSRAPVTALPSSAAIRDNTGTNVDHSAHGDRAAVW
jgi:hypothetical protein